MSRVFEALAEEEADLAEAVNRATAQLREQAPGAARKATQAEAEAALQKADDVVQQMELEARSSKGAEAKALQSRAKAYKSELSVMKTTLKQAAAAVPSAVRAELLGGSSGDEAADDQRARLLRMGERMQQGTGKLQQAQRTILDTEAIGESILGDLRAQRETLNHATGTLQRANEGLARSGRTLAAISRRALGNKLIMWAMIALLALMVLFLGYVELFGFGSGTSPRANGAKNATATGTG
jgi:vesicle transport through interaction with t-SNAREs protein 1